MFTVFRMCCSCVVYVQVKKKLGAIDDLQCYRFSHFKDRTFQ